MAQPILITGGAGYIGSHTARHLTANGAKCVIADNLVYGHREAVPIGAVFELVDLADRAALKALFGKYNFAAVVHFAAFAYVGESVTDPQKYYANNLIGTLNLLEAMLGAGVKKIVFSSTCATYGEPQYTPIDEAHPQHPINPYGVTKLAIERVFADYEKAYGLRHISLRYFNAAGAAADSAIGESHTPETHLIPLVLKAIKGETPPIKIFGTDYDTPDGTCVRDYIHVEDLAVAHQLALEKLGSFCGCLNLATGVGTSVREVIAAAEAVTGKRCPVEIAPRRAGDPAKLYAAADKAREILGWQPRYTEIKETIRTAWNWEQNRKF
ncbi:UDP-glucose 4-epimerase GalE [Campylobacterota bacterium]|nr:UDP-glucose 4-epimerase GalE [Campylobacterota bacterium]